MDHENNAAAQIPFIVNDNVSAVGFYPIDNSTEELNQLTAFIKRNCQDVRAVGKPFNSNFVCPQEVIIEVMLNYYFNDNFEVHATKLKDVIYLALKRNLKTVPNNNEPNRGLNVVELRTFGGFLTLYNSRCTGRDITEVHTLNDIFRTAVLEPKNLTNEKMDNKLDMRWLIECNLGGLIDSIQIIRNGLDEGLVTNHKLKKDISYNNLSFKDCFEFFGKFLNRVNTDMNDVTNHTIMYAYRFKRRVFDPEIGTARVEIRKGNLSQDYVEFINNFGN